MLITHMHVVGQQHGVEDHSRALRAFKSPVLRSIARFAKTVGSIEDFLECIFAWSSIRKYKHHIACLLCLSVLSSDRYSRYSSSIRKYKHHIACLLCLSVLPSDLYSRSSSSFSDSYSLQFSLCSVLLCLLTFTFTSSSSLSTIPNTHRDGGDYCTYIATTQAVQDPDLKKEVFSWI